MPDFSVVNYGTDTSGRSILMTKYMRDAHESVLADTTVKPFASDVTIVQGAFMSRLGGGAAASAGYHDLAGCIDYRTWNLTGAQLEAFIRAWRRRGGAAWRRDATHGGMDAHCHVTLGSDEPLAAGAKNSWQQYVAGENGLTGPSHGADYEWRPSPLVLRFTPSVQEDDDMQLSDKVRGDDTVRDALLAALNLETRFAKFRQNNHEAMSEVQASLDALEEQAADNATRNQIRKIRERLAAMADAAESPA